MLALGGDAAISVATLAFPDTAVGDTTTLGLDLTNPGASSTGTITVTATGDFTVDATMTTCGPSLAPSDSCHVQLVFHPTVDGTRIGTFSASASPGGAIMLGLAGHAFVAQLQLSPMTLDFAARDVATTTNATVHVTNVSGDVIALDAITVSGSGFTLADTTCDMSLGSGASCDIEIAFAPLAIGPETGTLTISTPEHDFTADLLGSGTGDLTVVLAGAGQGHVTSSPVGIECGASCTAPFDTDVVLTAYPATGSVFTGWSDPSCTTASCTVPAAMLPHSVTATFDTTHVTLTPSSADLGTVPIGSTVTATIVLENDGPLPVSIDSATVSAPFVITSSTTCGVTLDAVARCNYVVAFTPSMVGAVSGSLDVGIAGGHYVAQLQAAGGDYVAVTVQGQGTVTSSPSGIDCGSSCASLFSSSVTLTATPTPGNVLTSWSVGACTTSTCVVQPGTSITATFSPAPTHTVGGAVTGLASSGLILQDNDGDDLPIAADGPFTFATPVTSGLTYRVTVSEQPSGEACRVTNGTGTIGNADVTDVAITCSTNRWTMLSARSDFTCGLQGGTLWCWGNNNDGQLGDGTTTKRNVPSQVGTATTWTSVETGYYNTCAQQSDGMMWCWGDNQFGQLGNGIVGGTRATPATLAGASPWSTISIGGGYMCGIQTDGTLWCWGANFNGALGIGTTTGTANTSIPTQVGTDHDWTASSAGDFTACAIKTNGTLWCWGGNAYGAVGDGTTTDRSVPVQVGSDTWRSVSGGSWYTCGIKSDGTLWCWGYNPWGNLGDGTTTNRSSPVQVGTSAQWQSVSASDEDTCAGQLDGSIWCWGNNAEGQLGDGTTSSELTPKRVATSASWAYVSAGEDDYTCALATDNSLWCWGFNYFGQLGDGTYTNESLPIEVAP